MKYFVAIFVTAILVFFGATIYYKGIPTFLKPNAAVTSVENVATPLATATVSPVLVDESASISAIVKKALVAKHGPNANSLNVTVSKVEGDYAQGGASEVGGGGMWFAARQNGFWTLVWDGNGQIDCADISPFPGFPKSMIPECWDSSTQKLITR